MNQDFERGKEKGNEVLEAIELRILETLKKAGLYSGEVRLRRVVVEVETTYF